jgi:hypothetical protein
LQRADEIQSLQRISGDLAAMPAPGRRVGKTMRSRLQRMIAEHAGEMASLQRRLLQAQARVSAVACRLHAVLKPTGHIARLRGDEFVALVEQVRHESDAAHVAERLAHALENPFELSYGRSVVSVSVGIALHPRDAGNENALLHRADLAMYSAKSNAGGCYRFYGPELANLHGRNDSKQ